MNKELFLALETGDLAYIQRLHRHNSNVLLDVTFQGDTPLHIAAREGHLPIVQWMLHVKPSLAGVKNKDDNTPLHEAAKCVNPELVRNLLHYKRISAYHYNKFGDTALIIASKYGHIETVELLCEAKEYDDTSETERSLGTAAYREYPDIVRVIIGKPMKPRLVPLRYILVILLEWDTYTDVAKVILDNSIMRSLHRLFFNHIEITRATSYLHVAVLGGNLEIVEIMLNSPAWNNDLMTREDECGWCAIHVAAMKGSWDIIDVFMSRWPDCIEIRSSDHKSVLHFAVEYNQFEIVRNLILNKSPKNCAQLVSRDRDRFQNTTLHLAAKNGVDPQLVEYLVSFAGVYLKALNNEDMSALHIASTAAKDNPNCAIIQQILESAGATRLIFKPKSNTISDPSNESKQGGDKDIVNTHMVVASLIATVTFAAMFQIPGGIEDDRGSIHYGAAKMAFRKLFRFLIFSDTAAFTTSFTVVVVWLVRQLMGECCFGKTSVMSHISIVTLTVSILWTTAAFVSATIIVIMPSNYDNLRGAHMEAFSAYKSLWRREIILAIIPPIYVCTPLLKFVYVFFMGPSKYRPGEIFMYLDLSVVTAMIIYFTLHIIS
ncbi:hypothetical protein SUGI_0550730 [Cryptomeria japonica]|uniref:ankyrin repeat-containing protein At5g02620-like n=1 Tax=Cryptomeria japonica TaxID=3369 RepID=UPI002408E9AD|nr:ankyrin repeat-containing protein At5g02620-like [Cryptomeria japonica]GLJ28046.1 hypothetical protein SUGI_0550730 [Cryptomeria japonica]